MKLEFIDWDQPDGWWIATPEGLFELDSPEGIKWFAYGCLVANDPIIGEVA